MKIALLALAALISTSAHAELKAPGTVMANECAQEVDARTSVCYSTITGKNGLYLTIGTDVYAVGATQGSTTSIDHIGFIAERGRFEYRASLDVRMGEIKKVGNGDAIEISIRDQKINASDFQIVFHTMSL